MQSFYNTTHNSRNYINSVLSYLLIILYYNQIAQFCTDVYNVNCKCDKIELAIFSIIFKAYQNVLIALVLTSRENRVFRNNLYQALILRDLYFFPNILTVVSILELFMLCWVYNGLRQRNYYIAALRWRFILVFRKRNYVNNLNKLWTT